AAPCSRKAACSTDRRPLARPSTVLTVLPATLAAGIRQAQTGAPSTRTVQAPQSPASQPILVPVSPSSSRSTLDSLRRGGTQSETGASFTLRSIAIASRLMLPAFRCQPQLLHILHAARSRARLRADRRRCRAYRRWATAPPSVPTVRLRPGIH